MKPAVCGTLSGTRVWRSRPEGASLPITSAGNFLRTPNPFPWSLALRPCKQALFASRGPVQPRSLSQEQRGRSQWIPGILHLELEYFVLYLAESHLTPPLFRQILGHIERLAWFPT